MDSSLRVRISNAYGNRPLTIGGARIALRDKGPAAVHGSDRKLTFGGSDGTVIAAGAVAFSDPVELGAPALADLCVSYHLPGENFKIGPTVKGQRHAGQASSLPVRAASLPPRGAIWFCAIHHFNPPAWPEIADFVAAGPMRNELNSAPKTKW